MLIYEKKVLSDPSDTSSEKVRRLFGTKNKVPSISDEQLIYKDSSNNSIDATIVSTYKFAYNYDSGIKASTSTGQIPNPSDTVLNVYLGNEIPVIITDSTIPAFTISLNASNGSFDTTNAIISSTGSSTFELTAASGYVLPESIEVKGIVATYTYDASSGELTVSKPGSKVVVNATCTEE